MATLTIQLLGGRGFCALRNLRVLDLRDGDRLLHHSDDAPDARATLSLPPGPCDLLIEADGRDAARFQQSISAAETHVLLSLAEAEDLYISASYGEDVAVDFDGNVRQHLGPDGRPLIELCEEGELLRTFDAHGHSEWVWRGWAPVEPIGQHTGTPLALSALSAHSQGQGARLRLTLAHAPPGLRVIASAVGSHQVQGRLLAPEPLSAAAAAQATLAQATAAALPPPGVRQTLVLPVPYTRSGQVLGVLAFVPGGPFAYATCPVR